MYSLMEECRLNVKAERERARRCLESYLQGVNQTGHPPLSPEEIAEVYRAILSRVKEETK